MEPRNAMTKTPVVWTNDDIGYGGTELLERQLAFLEQHGIPGVFFVVPWQNDHSLDEDKGLLRVIEEARKQGHEFHQHGYKHDAYECGVPELKMLDFSPPTRDRYDTHRHEIEAMHTLEALKTMLSEGQKIWRRAFGEDSAGFRPPWGGYCTNLYRALGALDFQWVSARIPSMTSWQWNNGDWDAPMEFREGVPTTPGKVEGVMEVPMAGDYAFRVPNRPEKIEAMVDLALREFDVYVQRGDPMLIVSHHHGLSFFGEGDGIPGSKEGTGYAIHDHLIPALQATGKAEFTTMASLVEKWAA